MRATSAGNRFSGAFTGLTLLVMLTGCTQLHRFETERITPLHLTVPQIVSQLNDGQLTSVELVEAYQQQIAALDRVGPELRSVISLNPLAMQEAQRLDEMRLRGELAGPLHGLPIMLKDNIESKDQLPTTAGSLALQENITQRDAPLVAGLRKAGAFVLGKTNLSQWANFRSRHSVSGWSSLGGQVRNPHILDRTPCGSSSGSAVAVAASLAAAAIGTETNGSVICPASVNGIVGFKPTVGLISQQYIVPISSSQDTAGPMTRSVAGAALLMNAMSGRNEFTSALQAQSLDGKRVGVLRFAQGESEAVLRQFDQALVALRESGAEIVEIQRKPVWPADLRQKMFLVMIYEFRRTLNAYLADLPDSVTTRSLADLIAFNNNYAQLEQALFDQSIFVAADATVDMPVAEYRQTLEEIQHLTRTAGIDQLLGEYQVDVLVFPSSPLAPVVDLINGDVWPPFIGAGWMAAVAGYPHATVPMGTVNKLPIGLSFVGGNADDAQVLAYAYAYEQRTMLRTEPQFIPRAADVAQLAPALQGHGCTSCPGVDQELVR